MVIKASNDLQASKHLLNVEEPLLDIVVYHCQQAMEKALKGFLTCKAIGRWVVLTQHRRRAWEVIVEPDDAAELLVVVTAYPDWESK